MSGDHWSTRRLSESEVRVNYARIMSRAASSIDEAVEELELRLGEAREQGWLDEPTGDLRTRESPTS